MAENVEQIESQLAAYVDGELSGEEKLEIEKHLASNPTHRALISDLIAQKAMVQKLPSEPAPGDLTEGLQFQLEREVLLASDPLEEARRSSMRINRLPQILSMAAVAVLTAGLGIVVYSILPPRHPIAKIEPSAVPGTTENDGLRAGGGNPAGNLTGNAAGQDPLATRDEYRALGEGRRNEPRIEEALGAVRMRSSTDGPGLNRGAVPTRGGADRGAELAADRAVVEARMAERPSTGMFELTPNQQSSIPGEPGHGNTVILTVNATNVEAAREQIVAYLQANQITWRDQATGFDGTSHLAALARTDSAAQVKKTVDEVTREQGVLFQRQQSLAPQGERLLKDETSLEKQAAEFKEELAAKQRDGASRNETASGQAAPSAAGTTSPAPAGAIPLAPAAKPDALDRMADHKSRQDSPVAALVDQPVVVANLSAEQMQELAKALSEPGRNQSAVVQRVSGVSGAVSGAVSAALAEAEQLKLKTAYAESEERGVRFAVRRGIENTPATMPSGGLIAPANTGLSVDPASRPSTSNGIDTNNLAYFGAGASGGAGGGAVGAADVLQQAQGRALEVFQCVIVLKPQGPATQPTTRPTTQPVGTPATLGTPATQPVR